MRMEFEEEQTKKKAKEEAVSWPNTPVGSGTKFGGIKSSQIFLKVTQNFS